jgi:predicted flap endonuclease-1-like 5' DNA nuclease
MSAPSTRSAVIPARSAEQRRAALAGANGVRTQRAQLKADLKRGEVSIAALIAEPPQYLASARVADLLRALRGYGPVKADRLLERCRVSPKKTIAGLSPRQREALIEALEK